MKPTYQIGLRAGQAQRPSGPAFNKSPRTEWNFQSGAELTAGTAPAASTERLPFFGGLYARTQGFYEAQTKWEDRIEAFGLCVVIALAAWPILQAVDTAMRTV